MDWAPVIQTAVGALLGGAIALGATELQYRRTRRDTQREQRRATYTRLIAEMRVAAYGLGRPGVLGEEERIQLAKDFERLLAEFEVLTSGDVNEVVNQISAAIATERAKYERVHDADLATAAVLRAYNSQLVEAVRKELFGKRS